MFRTIQLVQGCIINMAMAVQPAQAAGLHLVLDRKEIIFTKINGREKLGRYNK